jgi:transposase
VPEALAVALDPVLETIASLTERIRGYDRRLEALSRELYPETALLRQVGGVGPITALTFVLVLEDAARFGRSRSVGAYLGLAPGQRHSGESDPQENASPRGARSCSGSSWSRAPTTCSGPSPKTPTSGATA